MGSGESIVETNFELQPGTYYMNAANSTAAMLMDNEEGDYVAYPYSVGGVISITGIEPAWASTRYLHFYDWQVTSGNTCERTPVKAVVLDQNSPECNITTVNKSTDNKSSVYPNPTEDVVHLSSTQEYRVYSVLGNQLVEGVGNVIDMKSLPDGIYILKTENSIHQILKK